MSIVNTIKILKIKSLGFIALAVLTLCACAVQAPPVAPEGTSTGAKTKIRLPMGYIPNVQFAPYYVALSKGYFAAEGIDLAFDYKFETDGVKLVGAGELPFAVVSGEQVVLARAQGLPVKYFAEWYREFPIAVFFPHGKDIHIPGDLKGKTVGLPGFFGATFVGWKAFANAAGLKDGDVTLKDIGFTQAAAVQQGKVDAAVGYINNEPIVLKQNGFDVDTFPVGKTFDMVANGLLTNDKTLKDNPALVRGMARAVLKGVTDTIANPDEAMQLATKYLSLIHI